jgi:hypothetical protein
MAVTGRWRAATRTQLLLSTMVGESSKGPFQLVLHQMGAAQRRQARQVVVVAQNTVERRRIWFSSDFARIPHEGLPIYGGFAPRSCVARIQPRTYLQSEFEPDVG